MPLFNNIEKNTIATGYLCNTMPHNNALCRHLRAVRVAVPVRMTIVMRMIVPSMALTAATQRNALEKRMQTKPDQQPDRQCILF